MSENNNIDKDNAILKYEKDTVDKAEQDLESLSDSSKSQEETLNSLKDRLQMLADKKDVKLTTSIKEKFKVLTNKKEQKQETKNEELTYDELYKIAEVSLKERGLSPDELDFNDLISEEEYNEILKELNEGLPREDRWTKSDFIVTFTAAVLGMICDLVLSDRNNKLTGQNSKVSKELNKVHKNKLFDHSKSPIDFQSKELSEGKSWGFHRLQSAGHDLARPWKGIEQIRTGMFEAIKHENGMAVTIASNVTTKGNPYEAMGMIEAIVNWAKHMFADVFSTYSLPIPGYSYITEGNNRYLRQVSAAMYENGFNLKNVVIQSSSVLVIESVIRIYYACTKVKNIPEDFEIKDDYSNYEEINRWVDPKHKEKLNEMLLVAHAIVMLENTGRIALEAYASAHTANAAALGKCLSKINISEIIATCKYGYEVVKNTAKRNDEYAKLIYHSDEITASWEELDNQLCYE